MKEVECIPYNQTGYFSQLILDYLNQDPKLKDYISDFPSLEAFKARIEARQSFSLENRKHLTADLKAQYQEASVALSEGTEANIEALRDAKTFTVTTGHQLNILTGPLYFLYKIVSAINLSKQLKEAYPDYSFVPVYWMASEDHDFDEISFINLFGGRLAWNNDLKGPVGTMPTFGMGKVLDELESHLGSGVHAQEILRIFRGGYHERENLSQATRYIVNELFGREGLVIVDADRKALKEIAVPHFAKDLFQSTMHPIVEGQSARLAEYYFAQVHPRAINLFYCKPGLRERIEFDGVRWQVLNTDIQFNLEELKTEMDQHPERFSPNVVLRPLYQEIILPNLAYIGGGGEIAYWFQLKEMFDAEGIPFPLLMLRNSALLYSEKWANRMSDLKLGPEAFFQKIDALKKSYIKDRFPEDVELQKFDDQLEAMFSDLERIAQLTDQSMLGAVNAQRQKQLHGIANLRKKLIRAEKRRSKESMDKLERVYYALFPKGSLQERHDNLSVFYADYGSGLIETLLESLDPLDFRFTLIRL